MEQALIVYYYPILWAEIEINIYTTADEMNECPAARNELFVLIMFSSQLGFAIELHLNSLISYFALHREYNTTELIVFKEIFFATSSLHL